MSEPVTEISENAAEPDDVYLVTADLVRQVDALIGEGRPEAARDLLADLQPADVADVFEMLPRDDRQELALVFGADLDPDVLNELDQAVIADVAAALDPQVLASAILEMDSDEAVFVLDGMDEEHRDAVLHHVPAPDRAQVLESLSFPEDSAGRLMQRDMIAVPAYWTVGQVIDYCRDTEDLPDEFYEVYVVDPRFRPVGRVPLNRLMRSRRPRLMREIMEAGSSPIQVDMDQEHVAYLFTQYRMASAPVIDGDGRLVGMITFDDVAEVIEEEAEEDMMRLSGVSGESDLFEPVLSTARSRSLWLFVNLLTAVLASAVIAIFDATLEQIIALAILMPIVASMGGNAGTQTLTVAVRALATRELTAANAARILYKEVIVGGINGVIFAISMGLIAGFWFENIGIGAVIAAAMLVNMIVAGLFGMLVPLGLSRAGIDPAVAATVFLTTITDVIGFFAFLGLAALFLI
jgi:magnesium transporter